MKQREGGEMVLAPANDYNCLNCGAAVPGNFCGHCGQKRIQGRLTLHELQHEVIHGLLHADSSIFRLAWQCLIQPGIVAREYLSGRRKRFFPLVQFYFINTALLMFVLTQTSLLPHMTRMMRAASTLNGSLNEGADKEKLMQTTEKVQLFLFKYSALMNLALIPFFAGILYILYKRYRLGFAERYLLVLMAFNQSNLIVLILYLVALLNVELMGPVVMTWSIVITLFAMFLTLYQYFREPVLSSFGKSLLTILGGFLTGMLTLGIISMIVVLTYVFLNKVLFKH